MATLGYKYVKDKLKGEPKDYGDNSSETYLHDVSVIIPAYNAESSIDSTVKSLYDQTFKLKKVIVVDDCSTDNTSKVCEDLAAELGDGFFYIRRDKNMGKASNINYIVKEHGDLLGDITVVTDSDILLDEKCIENLVSRFDSDVTVAAVTPHGYTLAPENRIARILYYGNNWNNNIFKIRKRAQGYRNAISVICGANTAYRTDVLKDFPIPIRTLTEDTDYTWVLQENGLKIVYDESALIHSYDLEKPSSMMNQWFRWYSGSFQCLYIHGRELAKAKSLLWTTILPSTAEAIPYSLGVITLPIIAAANMAMPGEIPLNMNYVYGFLIADFLLTTVPTAIIAPKYLVRLPQIYVYKFVGSALTLKAFLKTMYEKIAKKEHTWSNTWSRDYGFTPIKMDNDETNRNIKRDTIVAVKAKIGEKNGEIVYRKLTKNYMAENIDEIYALEINWTGIGEKTWDESSFFQELPKKWDLSFVAESEEIPIGYLIGSQANDTSAKVNKILVDNDFRGIGVGRKLVDLFEDECLRNGITETELKALIDNLQANEFYVRHKYRPVGLVKGDDDKIRNHYRKKLEERRLNENPTLKTNS